MCTRSSSITLSPSFNASTLPPSLNVVPIVAREKQIGRGLRRLRCIATPIPDGQRRTFEIDEIPQIKWPKHDLHTLQIPSHNLKADVLYVNKDHIDKIRSILRSMSDGEISVSAYDTAWVAFVKDIHGKPQFPTSLEWIAKNQLEDGSWGDKDMFEAHDRIINTLACVIALTTWNIFPDQCAKGMEFIRENLSKLGDEKDEHMSIGFEVVFPSLIEIGRDLGIKLLDTCGVLPHIYAQRNIKLQRIPEEILYNIPTSLLHSLEGMIGLKWKKLFKLQSKDGSFLFSPASTAYALMQTRDLNCLRYLENAVSKFNGGVPNVYPVDLFEHIWVVDRLERLGIGRFFKDEINESVDYVHRHWTEHGICWARNSNVQDIDDTAMGFRLLRLHGYDVSPDVFKNFKKNGEFFCFAGQSTQAVTGMYNLLRASQLQYPGEDILEEARYFSSKYLTEKQACNQLFDKWIIMKDLPGEVGYALDLPWYANLPRIETRFYVEQYGGDNDVWIGKTLYRMPFVNNNLYLELAKFDFNSCQDLHKLEWYSVRRWYEDYDLKEYGLSEDKLLRLYFVAAASIFEPEISTQRLVWAKTAALVETISSHFGREKDHISEFTDEFFSSCESIDLCCNERKGILSTLQSALQQLSLDVLVAQGVDIRQDLHQVWKKWMVSYSETGDRYIGEAELLTRTIQVADGLTSIGKDFQGLVDMTNKVCHKLGHFQTYKHITNQDVEVAIPNDVNEDMQRLAEMVFSDNAMDMNSKLGFWGVARSYYYTAYCCPSTIDSHIDKVIFERVASS